MPDFALGALQVSPARRHVSLGEKDVAVEPRVMQVLVLLARHVGEVVSRAQLIDTVWGVAVGDDSINRAVAGVRRALALDPALAVETIPRTGYRMKVTGQGVADAAKVPVASRRTLLLGGGAAALATAATGGWWLESRARDHAEAMAAGEAALDRGDLPAAQALFARIVANRPDDAEALGRYAYALVPRTGMNFVAFDGDRLAQADRAARQALAIDPRQGDARLALVILDRPRLDLAATEERYRAILRDTPGHGRTLQEYWRLLACVGRTRDGLALVDRALARQPYVPNYQFPRAQFLWMLGRQADADRVMEQVFSAWSELPGVRFARFTILAFTGRAPAALAMIDNPRTAPQVFSPRAIALWRVSLPALDHPAPAVVAAAVDANLRAARSDLSLTPQAVETLSALGQTEPAFALVNALFAVPEKGTAGGPSSMAWRFAPWLFIPPLAAMRADPRFGQLCRAIGLTDYWTRRGIRPDLPVNLG